MVLLEKKICSDAMIAFNCKKDLFLATKVLSWLFFWKKYTFFENFLSERQKPAWISLHNFSLPLQKFPFHICFPVKRPCKKRHFLAKYFAFPSYNTLTTSQDRIFGFLSQWLHNHKGWYHPLMQYYFCLQWHIDNLFVHKDTINPSICDSRNTNFNENIKAKLIAIIFTHSTTKSMLVRIFCNLSREYGNPDMKTFF